MSPKYSTDTSPLTSDVATPGQEKDHFTADWLSSREQADHAARDVGLTQTLVDALAPLTAVRVFDLGSGTGSNLRYLAPRLPMPQHWTLFDHDAQLLKVAEKTCVSVQSSLSASLRLQTQSTDLTRMNDINWPHKPHLVTASALLDLVSTDWLQQLAILAADWQAVVLFTLSYNGEFSFTQPLADDALVRDAFNSHQRSGGLGPDAAGVASVALQQQGFRVLQAISTWQLHEPRHSALKQGMIRGWADAATEQAPEQKARIAQWQSERLSHIPEDHIRVGHVDLLALPDSRGPAVGS